MPNAQPPSSTVAEIERELRRVTERLRTLPLSALSAPVGPWSTRAEAAFAVAQELADTAAAAENVPRRGLPRLPDAALGDQLTVCAADLVAALRADPTAVAWGTRGLAALRGLRTLLG